MTKDFGPAKVMFVSNGEGMEVEIEGKKHAIVYMLVKASKQIQGFKEMMMAAGAYFAFEKGDADLSKEILNLGKIKSKEEEDEPCDCGCHDDDEDDEE